MNSKCPNCGYCPCCGRSGSPYGYPHTSPGGVPYNSGGFSVVYDPNVQTTTTTPARLAGALGFELYK